jgi:hypothetical protein
MTPPKLGTARLVDKHLAPEPGLESVDQHAWRSQSGKLDGGLGTKLRIAPSGRSRPAVSIFSAGSPGRNPSVCNASKSAARDQMVLAQVGHPGPTPMTDERTRMDISGSQPLYQNEALEPTC